jgi:hypothetical protein
MNRHTMTTVALCSTLLVAATVLVPTAQAGNVAWGVSVGGPGLRVTAGQPGYYGGRGFYGAPYRPIARPYYRPNFRPYYPATFRAAVVVPPVYFAPPPVAYPYYPPAPAIYAPRRVLYPPQPFAYGYSGYGPGQMHSAPNSGSY